MRGPALAGREWGARVERAPPTPHVIKLRRRYNRCTVFFRRHWLRRSWACTASQVGLYTRAGTARSTPPRWLLMVCTPTYTVFLRSLLSRAGCHSALTL